MRVWRAPRSASTSRVQTSEAQRGLKSHLRFLKDESGTIGSVGLTRQISDLIPKSEVPSSRALGSKRSDELGTVELTSLVGRSSTSTHPGHIYPTGDGPIRPSVSIYTCHCDRPTVLTCLTTATYGFIELTTASELPFVFGPIISPPRLRSTAVPTHQPAAYSTLRHHLLSTCRRCRIHHRPLRGRSTRTSTRSPRSSSDDST